MLAGLKQHLETRAYPLPWPGHWIDGAWVKGDKNAEEKNSFNPSRGIPLLRFTTSKTVIGQAITSAEACFLHMQEVDYPRRIAIIAKLAEAVREHQSLIIACMQVETGKPAWEAKADTDAACDYLHWVGSHGEEIRAGLLAPASLGARRGSFHLNPIGITAAYLPFSTPLSGFVLAFTGALLAGCPLIVISSAQAALCALVFAAIGQELDLPKGLFNVVFGGFSEFKETLNDPRVRAAIYTGSKEHCETLRKDYRGFRNRQLILQAGGKNAALVHSTADLDQAVRAITYAAFKSAGQLCSSTSRVFVFRSLMPDFIAKLYQAASKLSIGPTDDLLDFKTPAGGNLQNSGKLQDSGQPQGPLMGPLYSKKSVEKFLRFQTMAHRDAAETIYWGKESERHNNGGFFVSPGIHLMKQFDKNSAYQNNVLFSPDLALYSYDVLSDAVSWINETDSCLAVSFFGDADIIKERQHLFHAPNLLVNSPTTEVEVTLPLAGHSLNSLHRYHGPGLALYLSYPQSCRHEALDWQLLNSWPWI